MIADEDTILKIMRLLDREPHVNQREIAHYMGISLGKAHQCIQTLLSRGWIRARAARGRLNRVGYSYPLTAAGTAEKHRLTAQTLWRTESEILRLQEEMALLRRELQQEAVDSPRSSIKSRTPAQARSPELAGHSSVIDA